MSKFKEIINAEKVFVDSAGLEGDKHINLAIEENAVYKYFDKHSHNLEEAKEFLLKKNEEKYNKNINKAQTIEEEKYSNTIKNQSNALVERTYLEYKLRNMEKEYSFITSYEDPTPDSVKINIEYKELELKWMQSNLLYLTAHINLLKLLSNEEISIFNLPIDARDAKEALDTYKTEEEKEQERDGQTLYKLEYLERLKEDIKLHKEDLQNAYEYLNSMETNRQR